MTRLNIRGLLALFLTVLTLGLGQVPASAQVIGRVPYLSPNPCKGVTLSLAFARSTGSNCLNGSRYASVTNMPGWTYTGGTPAGTGSYAPKADGSLQFFPSVTNLLLQSQTFDNASWAKSGGSITANTVAAPDGTTTADTFTGDGAGPTSKNIAQTLTVTAAPHTYSVYAKAGSNSFVQLRFSLAIGGGTYANFNLSNGTVGDYNTQGASITDVGNGWYRCTVTYGLTAASGSVAAFLVSSATAASAESNSLSTSVYLWGAQLELGSTASTYIPTTTAAVTVAPPRITDAGYLAEEARTNRVAINNTNPTVTTGITKSGDAAATLTIVSDVAELAAGGLSAAVTGGQVFKLDNTSGSVFAQASISGGTLNTNPHTVSMYVRGSGSGRIGVQNTGGTVSAYTTGYVRRTATITPSFTSAEAFVTAQPGSVVYFILMQLEEGSFATSPIPTTSVAVTRAADVGYISGLTVPSAVSLVASGSPGTPTASGAATLAAIDDGTTTNRVGLYKAITTGLGTAFALPGSWFGGDTAWTTNALGRIGMSSISGTQRGAFNGASMVEGNVAQPSGLSRLVIGTRSDLTTQNWNGPIRRIVIYPRAMSNSELQAITIGPVSFANDNAPDDMRAALWGWVA